MQVAYRYPSTVKIHAAPPEPPLTIGLRSVAAVAVTQAGEGVALTRQLRIRLFAGNM